MKNQDKTPAIMKWHRRIMVICFSKIIAFTLLIAVYIWLVLQAWECLRDFKEHSASTLNNSINSVASIFNSTASNYEEPILIAYLILYILLNVSIIGAICIVMKHLPLLAYNKRLMNVFPKSKEKHSEIAYIRPNADEPYFYDFAIKGYGRPADEFLKARERLKIALKVSFIKSVTRGKRDLIIVTAQKNKHKQK